MSTLTTRSGKGSPLTNNEVDTNFTNLNSDKYQSGDDVSAGAITFTGTLTAGINASVTAAGTTQGDATALTKTYNIVQTATSNQGVKLPDCATGVRVTVFNSTANIIKIYPASSESIDDGSLNAPITLGVNKVKEFVGVSATQWLTIIDDLENITATTVTTSGDITVGDYINHSVAASVSSAGSTQGDATGLTNSMNVITTVGADTEGVVLPTAVAGRTVTVFNATSTNVKLYPASSDTINSGSANAAITLPANTSYSLTCKDATDWKTHRPLAVYDSSGTLLN